MWLLGVLARHDEQLKLVSESGCLSEVPVMQSTQNRLRFDLATLRQLDSPWLGAALLKPQVSPASMIVAQVLLEHTLEVPLIEDDHVIQAFPPDRSDHPLDVRILPGGTRRRQSLLVSHEQ